MALRVFDSYLVVDSSLVAVPSPASPLDTVTKWTTECSHTVYFHEDLPARLTHTHNRPLKRNSISSIHVIGQLMIQGLPLLNVQLCQPHPAVPQGYRLYFRTILTNNCNKICSCAHLLMQSMGIDWSSAAWGIRFAPICHILFEYSRPTKSMYIYIQIFCTTA